MNSKSVSYLGRQVFIGIDVHKTTYAISCQCAGVLVKRWQMKADMEKLVEILKRDFEGGILFAAYEAGFSGYKLYRYLESKGIKTLVVNPASIEVSSRDRVKTDKKDSVKIANQLAAGRLRGIQVPTVEQEQRRLITRSRQQLIKERTRIRNQIRFRLHQFNLIPCDHRAPLSRKFVNQAIKGCVSDELIKTVNSYISVWDAIDLQISDMDKEIKEQSKNDVLEPLYRSVSGIGIIAARVLSNELGNMKRFANEKALFSYIGLTPQEYSSGEHRRLGHISRQGNSRVRGILVECAWTAL